METDLLKDHRFRYLNSLDIVDVSVYVGEQIKMDNPHSDQLIKYASLLGASLTLPLNYSIRKNNLSAVIQCIKYGADIFYQSEGETYIHFATIENNETMLKYFISKGLDINKRNNNGYMAAELALTLKRYKCYKILVENGAHMYNISKTGKKINHIDIMLVNYEPEMNQIIEFVIERTDPMIELNTHTFEAVKNCIVMKQDIAGKIIHRFPNFANKVIDNVTLLLLLIEGKQLEMVNKILKLKTTILNPPHMCVSYLGKLCTCGTDAMDSIKFLIEKAPKLINRRSRDGNSPVDFIMEGYKNYTQQECMDTIKMIIDKVGNKILNNHNERESRTIELAIQYTDTVIINFLIDQGIDINEKIKDSEYNYNTQIANNDPLSFACQLDHADIVKILLDRGCTINLSDQMPIAMLTSINNNRIKSLDVLMSNKKIRDILNDPVVKKKLINFCLNNTSSKEIMRYFIDDNKLDNLQINQDTILFNKIERFFENIFPDYQNKEKREHVMHTLYHVASFYKQLTEIGNLKNISLANKKTKKIMNMIVGEYFDAIRMMGKWKKVYEHCLLSLCFDFDDYKDDMKEYTDNIISIIQMQRSCPIHGCKMHNCASDEEPLGIWNNMINSSSKISKLTDKFTEILNILDSKRNIKYMPDEISEYSLHSETDTDYIQRVLVPLEHPFKVPHYDEMYTRLSGLNCTMSETSTHIIVNDNVTKITSIIFNEGPYKPKIWFKYYKYNIGKENKDDHLHLFPFILDKKLKDISCHQKSIFDRVNHSGSVLLVSFLGMLKYNDEFTLGIYEYYIDSTGSLFHRFFKPYEQLPDKIKNELGVATKAQVREKCNLARELIKHF